MSAADSIYFSYRRKVNDSNSIYIKPKTDSLLSNNYSKAYNYVRGFCLENKNNLVGIVALYSRYGESQILDYDIDFDVFEKVSKAVNISYPDNDHAINLKKFVDEKYRLIAHGEEVEQGLNAGNIAPEIIRPNPEGKQVELSSFRGHYLVLAFWSAAKKSSWEMNAGLKRIANEFKNKKVDILSVSMDKDKLQWVNTIALDHLRWNHVLSSESVENAYNLKDESRLFLIDKEGIILAKDISTDSLETLLNQLVK
jgi:peroxiredoxin